MWIALLVYAVLVSVAVPAAFLTLGPVSERRRLLASTYSAMFALGWCASLVLGFLSPAALGLAAALLSTFGLLTASYSWRDERLLARFDAQLFDGAGRAEAVRELQARVLEIGAEGPHVVALMEVASYPIRRLISRGRYLEALALLDFIDEHLGARMGAADASEARLLRARALLHLGRCEEAEVALAMDREAGTMHPEEADLLEALLRVCGGQIAWAESLLDRASTRLWSGWTQPLAPLVRAHVAAARGRDDRALRLLASLAGSWRESTLSLARSVPGPASDLATLLERPSAPYR